MESASLATTWLTQRTQRSIRDIRIHLRDRGFFQKLLVIGTRLYLWRVRFKLIAIDASHRAEYLFRHVVGHTPNTTERSAGEIRARRAGDRAFALRRGGDRFHCRISQRIAQGAKAA